MSFGTGKDEFEMTFTSVRRTQKARIALFATLSACLVLTTGCNSMPSAHTIEPAVTKQKPQKVASRKKSNRKNQTRSVSVQPSLLSLSVTYTARVLVPRGSTIKIDISDRNGRVLESISTSTRTDAPPYSVSVPVANNPAYPLRVSTRLSSPIGHEFSRIINVTKSQAASKRPVQITLSIQ